VTFYDSPEEWGMFLRYALFLFLTCLTLFRGPSLWSAPPKKTHQERTDHFDDPLPDGAAFRVGTTRLRHHSRVTGPFVEVQFNSNGKFVFSSARDEHEVRMWETATGREVRRFRSWT